MLEREGCVLSTLYIGPKDFKWKSHIKKGRKFANAESLTQLCADITEMRFVILIGGWKCRIR